MRTLELDSHLAEAYTSLALISEKYDYGRVSPADDTPRGSPAVAIFDEVLTPFSAAPCARTESEFRSDSDTTNMMWK